MDHFPDLEAVAAAETRLQELAAELRAKPQDLMRVVHGLQLGGRDWDHFSEHADRIVQDCLSAAERVDSLCGSLYRLREAYSQTETATADVLAWVSAAAASGVIGSVAYEAVKAAVKVAIRSPSPGRPEEGRNWLLAKAAIQARCAELGYRVPRLEDMKHHGQRRGPLGTSVTVVSSELRGVVLIPLGDLDGSSRLEVTIHQTPT